MIQIYSHPLEPQWAQWADLAVSLHRAHICQEVDPYSEVSSSQREQCAQTWLLPNSWLTAILQRQLWWRWRRPAFLTEGTPGHSSQYLGRSRLGVLEASHPAKWPTELMLHEQCDIAWKLKFHSTKLETTTSTLYQGPSPWGYERIAAERPVAFITLSQGFCNLQEVINVLDEAP